MISCAIRRVSPTAWQIIDDARHSPTGVKSIAIVNKNCLKLTYSFTATKVSSFQVSPDEVFACASLRVGASVGLAYAYIYCYLSGSTKVNPGNLTAPGGNLWVTAIMEVEPVAP